MATSNGGFLHSDPPRAPHPQSILPPWLSKSNSTTNIVGPPSPSVTLSLCPSTVPPPSAAIHWLQPDRGPDNTTSFASASFGTTPHCGENFLISELTERCRELEEGHRAWAAHKKEAAWRLNRLELQLESEKAARRREKMEEIDLKVRALREEGKAALDRIEAEYREQLAGLRRDAESKEQKLAEQWAAKHLRLTKFLEQMGCRPRLSDQANGRSL